MQPTEGIVERRLPQMLSCNKNLLANSDEALAAELLRIHTEKNVDDLMEIATLAKNAAGRSLLGEIGTLKVANAFIRVMAREWEVTIPSVTA